MDVMRTTKSGQILTEELIEAMAAEAEAGFDPSQLRPRPVRRASSDDGNGPCIEFQVDRATFEILLARAEEENRGVGEIARIALERYLCNTAPPTPSDTATAAPIQASHTDDVATTVE
jgi:CRISPR-associated endonuclease/helicase Cas3